MNKVNDKNIKNSGKLCSEKSHDNGNKMQDYRNGNSGHGNRIYMYEECTDWKNLYRSGLGIFDIQ